jgi:signal transduction histidine kinase
VTGAALTMLAAVEVYRTKSNNALERSVLRDYSSFVAWAFANALEETLRASAREALGAVNHGDALHMSPNVPEADDLAHYLYFDSAGCFCHKPTAGPMPETFFAFEIEGGALKSATNAHPEPLEGWEIDRPLAMPVPAGLFTGYSDSERDTVVRLVRHVARDIPDRENGFTYVIAPLARGPRAIAYTLMPTAWGDTMVYGAQYTPRAIQSVLVSLMEERDLLPSPFRLASRNADVIDIAVVHNLEHVLFRSGVPEDSPYASRAQLSPRFASLEVFAAIKPEYSSALIVGGLPRSRLPFLIGLLSLSALLTIVAVMQLRRESELARVRADWIASVSHELRTPLAQVRLYLDTVRLGRTPTQERRDWALDQVDREATRLGHLVEKVLSFSRFERGKHEALQPEHAEQAIDRIVEEFRPLAEARGVTIETGVEAGPPVTLRRDGIRHVLLNLLENAVKYGPDGQTVRVELRRAGGDVQLSVTDQGPGVPRDEQESVWRPFTRGRDAQERGGSGIGLAIVREIATEAGGRAWIEDAPNGGARFVVAFPAGTQA